MPSPFPCRPVIRECCERKPRRKKKGYAVIIFAYDISNEILSRDSNYIADLALGMAFNFYTSLAKGFKLKVRKFWGLILTFLEIAGENLLGRGVGVFVLAPI